MKPLLVTLGIDEETYNELPAWAKELEDEIAKKVPEDELQKFKLMEGLNEA